MTSGGGLLLCPPHPLKKLRMQHLILGIFQLSDMNKFSTNSGINSDYSPLKTMTNTARDLKHTPNEYFPLSMIYSIPKVVLPEFEL